MSRQLRQLLGQSSLLLFVFTLVLSVIWYFSQNSIIEPIIILVPSAINLSAGVRTLFKRRFIFNLQTLAYLVWLITIICLSVYWLLTQENQVEPLIVLLNALNSSSMVIIQYRRAEHDDNTRQDLLTRVRKRRIADEFDQTHLVELNKTYVNEVVNPIGRIPAIKQSSQVNRQLIDVFDEAEHLLILGEPGGGKTTSLQKLASDLLAQTENDELAPVPVYFELTEWAKDKPPLEEWLIREFHREYSIRDTDAQACLNGYLRIVLLLDGLDEMSEGDIQLCVLAINRFLTTDDTSIVRPHMVVCSRIVEYNALATKLRMNRAIQLNPLTADQIKAYINQHLGEPLAPAVVSEEQSEHPGFLNIFFRGGSGSSTGSFASNAPMPVVPATENRARLESFLELNETMEQVLNTPLILDSVLRSNITLQDLGTGSVQEIESRILQLYIEDVMQRRLVTGLNRALVDTQLAWLAKHMGDKSRFHIEDLQPSWLNERLWRVLYVVFTRLFIALTVAFGLGFVLGGVTGNLVGGVMGAVVVSVIDYSRYALNRRSPRLLNTPKPGHFARFLRGTFYYFLMLIPLILVLGTYYGLTEERAESDMVNVLGMRLALSGINQGIFLSLFFSSIFGVKNRKDGWANDIDTIENLRTTPLDVLLSALLWAGGIGVIIGGLAMVYYFISIDLTIARWLVELADTMGLASVSYVFFLIGFMVGGVAGLVFGIMFGGAEIVEKTKESLIDNPNKGLQQSLRNAIQSALIFGSLSALGFALLLYALSGDLDSMFKGIFDGIAVGIITFVSYGGADLIKHNVLRIIFYIKGLPFHYLDRLDEIKKSTLVKRVGRGYGFYHLEVQRVFQQKPSFKEKFNLNRAVMTIVFLVVGGVVSLLILVGHGFLYRYDVPSTAFAVSGLTQPEDEIGCVEAGETVQVRSKGNMQAGVFIGFVRPEGTEIGLLGLPIYDTYDIVPEFPHSSLLCRMQGDSAWQGCVSQDAVPSLPFIWREYAFTASRAGCLEFHVNDKEVENHLGQFWVEVVRLGEGIP